MVGSGHSVEDFTPYCEGDVDPTLNKKIRSLVSCDREYIVYLDDDLSVQWSCTDSYEEAPEYGEIANGVAHLDTLSGQRLSSSDVESLNWLLAEAMARIMEKDARAARQSLDNAEAYLKARSLERARVWYLSASFSVAIMALLIAWALWMLRVRVTLSLGDQGLDIAIGALFGSLGALVSILERLPRIQVEASAGRLVHFLEGGGRVLMGMAGGFVAALAVNADLLFAITKSSGHHRALLLMICISAGASERFLPGLIKQVEDSALANRGR